MDKLTIKQKQFVDEYIIDFNATRAYKAAYGENMSDASASGSARKLLGNTLIQEIVDKKTKTVAEKAGVTAEKVIREIAGIAFDDISNYLSFKNIPPIKDKDGKITDIGGIRIKIKDSDKINTQNISKVQQGKDGQFKFKLYSRDNALALLGKHLGMFVDRVGQEDNININVTFDCGDED